MSFKPFTSITAKTLVLPAANIDTDQIIPARFLTTTSRESLGQHLFHDWRETADHILNTDAAKQCQILVAGENFGCGSSREHAPWALADFGFRAVISSKIADIFHANALKNGLLPIVIEKSAHQWLLDHPGEEIIIDLKACEVRLPKNGGTYSFNIDQFSRQCLMKGMDELDVLNDQSDDIAKYEGQNV